MPDRIDIDIVSVWSAIMTRLQTALSLSADTCFWWLDDNDPPPPSANSSLFITVSPDGGTFDPGFQESGGSKQVTVETAIRVTVHSTSRLGTGMRDDEFLTNASGLGPMLTNVISALVDFDPVFGIGANPVLRAKMDVQGFEKPYRNQNDSIGGVTVVFGVSFDWLIS